MSPVKLVILPIAGFVVGIPIILFTQPWTEALGVAYSPARIAVFFGFTFTALLAWGVYWLILYARHPDWLVPPDKYSPGMKVKMFSTWTWVSIGITAAAFIAGGLVGAVTRLDLPGFVIAAVAANFGSVVAFFGMYIGEIIAYGPLAASTGTFVYPGIEVIADSLLDASVWSYAGFLLFWMRRTNVYKRSRVLGILLAMALFEPIHYGYWYIYWFIMNPWSSFVPVALANLAGWVFLPYGPAPLLVFIGALAGDRLYSFRASRAIRKK